VTWNGGIPGEGGSMTLAIHATIKAGTDGQTISNQGSIAYDSDHNGTNETSTVTDDPTTIVLNDPTTFVVGSPETPAATAASLPPPPGTPVCMDQNVIADGVLQAEISDALVYGINCRLLYENGQITDWLGGSLYNAGSIGIPGIVELGIEQAVDIFSPIGLNYFNGGAVFCLKGEGTLIWMAASHSPRIAEIIGSYPVPEFPGFTCATLFEPGTLVLVSKTPGQ